jgi:hypothetical protein
VHQQLFGLHYHLNSIGVVDPSTPLLYGLAEHSVDMESAKRLWELSENLVEQFLTKN